MCHDPGGAVWKEENADFQCECVFGWSCDLRTVQQCWRLLTVLQFPETYTPLVKGSLQPVMKCWYKNKFSMGCLYVYLGQIAKVSLCALVSTQGNRISYQGVFKCPAYLESSVSTHLVSRLKWVCCGRGCLFPGQPWLRDSAFILLSGEMVYCFFPCPWP